MTVVLVLALAAAAWLAIGSQPGPGRKIARLTSGPGRNGPTKGTGRAFALARARPARRRRNNDLPLMVLVHQLAALLRGGRSASKLWDEAWAVHGSGGSRSPEHAPPPWSSVVPIDGAGQGCSVQAKAPEGGEHLSEGSVAVLAAARSAAGLGMPVATAIRTSSASFRLSSMEQRVWGELAGCLEVAEASGCPLADILTRYAAHLEAEDDAEAARQTALAGPKATVRLLSWLPLFGLGLGTLLGVDPLGILLGHPLGLAALAAGILLTIAGRVWSVRLVWAAVSSGGPA
ncbi:hypothetical protein BIU82_08915 [Arthrobacter sp. SW1]|uniref:hypothetical protein n=1 Tax=Arthrobacter sp. SW1 TaxID=1920889 RepID=UPI000877BB3C|nr:hypothetical protein [Arthrobacter sp. SW1]OFI37207.1 hypothetical protein BIU82_08915 [Arthrobacter sp. SW1]